MQKNIQIKENSEKIRTNWQKPKNPFETKKTILLFIEIWNFCQFVNIFSAFKIIMHN